MQKADENCGHPTGYCSSWGVCTCDDGWMGPNCLVSYYARFINCDNAAE